MTFGDNNFIKWYENLSEKEQEEVWKEIEKRMEEELAEVKDIKLEDPHTFTIEKFENLSNTLSLIYKTGRE